MRTWLSLIVLLSLAPSLAQADDEDRFALVVDPRTPRKTLDAVLAAHAAGDRDALKEIASTDEPDVWVLADALCLLGEHDAAAGLARVAPESTVGALTAYVERLRADQPDRAARERLNATNIALMARRFDDVLAQTEGIDATPDDVVGVRMIHCRLTVLLETGRGREAIALGEQAARAAGNLGWARRQVDLLMTTMVGAVSSGDADTALRLARETAPLAEENGHPRALTAALQVLTDTHLANGGAEAALPFGLRFLETAESLGDPGAVAAAHLSLGDVYRGLEQFQQARQHHEKALAMFEAAGDSMGTLTVLINAADTLFALGETQRALEFSQRAADLATLIEDQHALASALLNLAAAHGELEAYDEASQILERLLGLAETLADDAMIVHVLGNLGVNLAARGELRRALEVYERMLRRAQASGDRAESARALAGMAGVYVESGHIAKALGYLRQVVSLLESSKQKEPLAHALAQLADACRIAGRYSECIELLGRAHALYEEIGHRPGTAKTLTSFGTAYAAMGDAVRARGYFERAIRMYETMDDRAESTVARVNLASALHDLGDFEGALKYMLEVLARYEIVADLAGQATVHVNLGVYHDSVGEYSIALEHAQKALALYREQEDRYGAAHALGNVGHDRWMLGDEEGIADIETALEIATHLRIAPLEASLLQMLARIHLTSGRTEEALQRAQQALREIEDLFAGLGDLEGATGRASHAPTFDFGVLAAAALGDVGEALRILESGRAGSMLETLGLNKGLRMAALPRELSDLQLSAKAGLSTARAAYVRAIQGGRRKAIARAGRALDEAEDVARAVAERIRREEKRTAGLLYPRAAPMPYIQSALSPGDALVVYGICAGDALAIVLTPDTARHVELGPARALRDACDALKADVRDQDPTGRIAALEALLVKPLGLDAKVERVLVSPDEFLCLVPFSLLFEIPVVLTPSGTTHTLLTEDRDRRGTGVLALGDPDYSGGASGRALSFRGRALPPLPGSRAEAKQVGDVVLLGADANEVALREALGKRPRWRAVHFACHGLVDADKPTLSGLALARHEGEDGILTCMEALQSTIPADMVVLSACETATGRIVSGEGVIGFARAFMHAGAPRVLGSLWKVDDEATRVLMTRFYELWNGDDPSAGAAVALRQAQTFVREHPDHPEWKHPYYWAAWVLWGLPD